MAKSLDSYSDIEDDDHLTESFHKAAEHIKKLAHNLEPQQLLEIYGYYKQATVGYCDIPRPRFYELQAKSKWDAWNKLGNMTMDEAKKQYVLMISKLDSTFDPAEKSTENWVTVSSLINTDEYLSEDDKTIFDYCKEGNLEQLKLLAKKNCNLLKSKDDKGLGLIHWAADRGSLDILKFLINEKIDVNMSDSDGQTALHYAASCDYFACVDLLMKSGSDTNLKDTDGMKPVDLANDKDIKMLLTNT